MTNNPIKNHIQARTAKQYLETLYSDMMVEEISLDELLAKQRKAEDILEALDDFHQYSSIRIVVDNTKADVEIVG